MENKIEFEASTKPFNIMFTWGKKSIQITLINGADIFIFAQGLGIFLERNNIEHEVKEIINNEE